MFNYIIALVAGFFVKWVDWIEDDKKGEGLLKFPLAIIYGMLIGYLISQATFSELFIAALIAQVFARKIDNIGHVTGIFAAIATLLYFGLPSIGLEYFVYFLILAFMDEQKYPGRFELLSKWRMFLKVGAIALILIGRYDFAIAILMFDGGYMLFGEIRRIFFPEITIPEPKEKRKRFKKRKS